VRREGSEMEIRKTAIVLMLYLMQGDKNRQDASRFIRPAIVNKLIGLLEKVQKIQRKPKGRDRDV